MDPLNQSINTMNISQVTQTQVNQTSKQLIIDISNLKIEQSNTLNITSSSYISAQKQQKNEICRREPLKIKFKGIILLKVLSQIYIKSQKEYFPLFIKSLAEISKNTVKSKQSYLSFQQFQKRVLKVLIETFELIIDEIKANRISEAFKRLKRRQVSK